MRGRGPPGAGHRPDLSPGATTHRLPTQVGQGVARKIYSDIYLVYCIDIQFVAFKSSTLIF